VSWCAKSGATSGLGYVGTRSLFSRFHPMLLLVGCMCERHLRGKQIESEDDSNTAVNISLYRLSKDEYRAATDRLPHTWEKCVIVLVITLSRYV
jgi:hypothetical protein